MKKGWKIALITLGSLVGLVIATIVVACILIFTPERLTSIANSLTGKYIKCENHFDKVELTLFKTFPNVGIEIKGMDLINPYTLPEGAMASYATHNDTLARIGSLVVGIDLKAYLDSGAVIVRQLRLDDGYANLYTSPDGWQNYDILPPSESTDTGSTTLPDLIKAEKISVNNMRADYSDLRGKMIGHAKELNMTVEGKWEQKKIEGDVSIDLAEGSVMLFDSTDHVTTSAGMRDMALTAKGDWKKAIVNATAKMTLGQSRVALYDSNGHKTTDASTQDLTLKVAGKGGEEDLAGKIQLNVRDGAVALGGTSYVTERMRALGDDLLTVEMPFEANIVKKHLRLNEAEVKVLKYALTLDGTAEMREPGKTGSKQPIAMNMSFATNRWQIGELIGVLPDVLTQYVKGMSADGTLKIAGSAKGELAEGRMPLIDAEATLDNGRYEAPRMLPAPLTKIAAEIKAHLNLSTTAPYSGASWAEIKKLKANMSHSSIRVSGRADDIMGDMKVDATVGGDIDLADAKPFIPDTMGIKMTGKSSMEVTASGRLSDITAMNLEKVKAKGMINIDQLAVQYDTIEAKAPKLQIALRLPMDGGKQQKFKELMGARIRGSQIWVAMGQKMRAEVKDPDISVTAPNIIDPKQHLAAAFKVRLSQANAEIDTLTVYTDTLKLEGSVLNDPTKDNILKQWNPDANIEIQRLVVSLPQLPEAVRVPSFAMNYTPKQCKIREGNIVWGLSDYHLTGTVSNLEDWLSHKAQLRGDIHLSSNYTDVDHLMTMISGMGTPADTLQQQRVEDKVPDEADPFIVPKDVNVTLHTNIKRCIAFGNNLTDLGGTVTVNEGVAVLDQMGFVCKAARMQLTAIYKSPRVNHLFTGIDFHLLDIQIGELIDMIPSIDTLVPMLSAFNGRANFHLAAECNLNALYQPKMSTLLGAAAISGKDLVVSNDNTLADMARLLQFKDWREKDNNLGVDSLSVEMSVFRKEIKVYPFLLNVGKYQVCASGSHTLDNVCNYHLELLRCPLPVRLAIDVKGSLTSPKITLGTLKYAELYKPEKRNEVQTRTLELKKIIREALEHNVKER